MNDKKILKRIGEDCAYTFKGLHKTADILELEYKLYLIIPIAFSIISLGFSEDIPILILKVLAVTSLISTCYLIINQKEYEKITAYRKLANEYKKIYDKVENNFHKDNFDNIDEIQKEKDELSNNRNELTIISKAYEKTKNTIQQEMNLDWLKS